MGCLSQDLVDRLQDPWKIAVYLAVPKSESAKARSLERVIPALVTHLMGVKIVLAAVDFDDKTMLEADEVHDESLARSLSPEMVATGPP